VGRRPYVCEGGGGGGGGGVAARGGPGALCLLLDGCWFLFAPPTGRANVDHVCVLVDVVAFVSSG